MKIQPFKLERYFAPYEFTARYLLSPSDCEPLNQTDVLAMADEDSRVLWDSLSLGYTETQGHPLLREAIAMLYDAIQPEQILVAAPEECIFLMMQTLLNPGDHLIAAFPAYQSSYEIARSIGCEVSFWTPDSDHWHFDPALLEDLLTPQTKMLAINFPHNPTGALLTREQFDAVVNFARTHNLILFSDEMYRLSEHDAANRLPSACDVYERGVVLSGMSKSFALPGLRIGWLATQATELIPQLIQLKDYTTICNSAPSEILALMALRSKDEILKRNLDIIRANLAVLDAFFAQYSTLLAWQRPAAGTIGFPRLLTGESTTEFCRQLVEEHGVLLVPSSVFNYGDNHFRLGFGRRSLNEGLEVLSAYLDVLL